MIRKITLILGIMSLLIGCDYFSASQSMSAVQSEDHQLDKSTEQNEKKITQNALNASENRIAAIDNQEKSILLAEVSDLELTNEEKQGIIILVSACIHALPGEMQEYLLDRKMLESNNKENELWIQTNFLLSLYSDAYAEVVSKRLEPIVTEINEDKMVLTWEQMVTLLEMAGAKQSEDLQSYDYMKMWYQDGYYRFPRFYGTGEIFKEIDFEKIEKMEDGRVNVEGIVRLEYDYGAVQYFKITLTPNSDSVFLYSADCIRTVITHPDGVGTIGRSLVIQEPYKKPELLTNNPFDYIFELDGALYQMPFPAKEMERNGWKIEEQGALEAGDRKTVHVSKTGITLTLGLWNYDTVDSYYNECQVVWLKTGKDKELDDVNFKLAEGVENGQTKIEIEPLYRDYYNENYTVYSRRDALYNNVYGYDLYFEDDLVKGFQMGYAPSPWTRQDRIKIMTGSWEQDPQTESDPGENFEMEIDHIYRIDIDEDGIPDEIRIKFLGGIKWAGFLGLFVNDELNYVLRGLSTDQIYCDYMKIVVEDARYYFVFSGGDYATDFYRKIRLEKGWSKEVEFDLH